MRLNHVTFRRPAYWLALSLTLAAMVLLTACGGAAQPEPSTPSDSMESASTPGGESQDQGASSNTNNDAVGTSDTGDATIINLAIQNRATSLAREDLRVSQGDTVRLNLTSDEHGEIHLHGYDLTAQVSPDHPGELVFEAGTAGAFGINFHVFASESMSDSDHGHDGEPNTVVSEVPISVDITAEPDAEGGVDVHIATEGFRFAPESVDQPHSTGVGHAHIYADGEKLSRVFSNEYHIEVLPPGQHAIRVSLNTNDHSEYVFDGAKVESTVIVIVPDVGQAMVEGDHGSQHDDHDHGSHDHGDDEIIAEVHLGNLEVYP